MAKWDDPIGHIKAGMEEPPASPGIELAVRGVGWVPVVGDAIKKALDAIRGQEKNARLEFLLTAIVERLEVHEGSLDDVIRRLDQPEFNRLISVAIERIFFGANERKVKRFAAVITDAATNDKTEQQYEDAASYIRALDELSEDDIKVLKHLYNHQRHRINEEQSVTRYNEVFQENEMVEMLKDAKNLDIPTDEFYSRCHRLSGYGLAVPLDKSHGSMGNPDDFAFRVTLMGKRLVYMLLIAGETSQVTNKQPA